MKILLLAIALCWTPQDQATLDYLLLSSSNRRDSTWLCEDDF